MNAPAWAGVAVAALTLAWGVTASMLAWVLRAARERGTITTQLQTVVRDLDRIAADKDRVHTAILDQMRDDRQATDRRLRWLETHLWSARQRRGGDGS